MKTIFVCAMVLAGHAVTADAQVPQVPPQSDSLYVSGEAASSSAFAGGGGGVDWVHSMSARSSLIAGAGSMRLGGEAWTYGTLGAFTRRRDVWYSGTVGLGMGRSGPDSFPYVRLAGTATIPLARAFYAETEGQFARVNGTTVKVVKAGTLYTGLRRTSLRAAYIGAASPLQYWQYLFVRGDVAFDRASVLGGLTAGRGPTHLGTLGPELLLHTSQEIFVGGAVRTGRLRTTCVAQTVQQAGIRVARLMVTLQVPLAARSVVASETSK